MIETTLPRPRRYLGYTLRPYTVGVRWSVEGEFNPPRNGVSGVGVGDIRSLAEAKKTAREYERQYGKAGRRKAVK